MKKGFILVFIMACFSFTGFAQNSSKSNSDIVITTGNGEETMITQVGDDVHINVGKSTRQNRTSTRKKSSKTKNITINTNSNGSIQIPKIDPESLAVYKLFGDQYKRIKGCQLSIINGVSHYRQLKVNGRPDIVKEVIRLFEIDKEKAYNVVENYSEHKEETILSLGNITCGLNVYSDGNCDIFLSWTGDATGM